MKITKKVTLSTPPEPWPEDATSSCSKSVSDLSFSYMDSVFQRGASIHKSHRQAARRKRKGTSAASVELGSNARQTNTASDEQILTLNDLYAAPKSMQVSKLRPDFDKLYSDHNSKLVPTLWKLARPSFVPAGFCQLITVIAQVSSPLFVWQLLSILEANPNSNVFKEGIPFVFLILIADMANAFGTHRQRFLAMKSGVTLRAAMLGSIYERVLQLTPRGKVGLTTGSINNLFAIDTQKIYEVTAEGHLLWSAPLSMLLVAIMLMAIVGPSMAVGICLLLLFVPVVQVVSNKMVEIRKRRVKMTDLRVEIVNAMLQGIKVTKLNNFEERYTQRIMLVRNEELNLLRKELYVWSMVMAIQFISPVAASAGAFAAYVYNGNVLTTADAFTALLLFNALRFPINYASRLVGKVAQARESARRISLYMKREIRASSDMLFFANETMDIATADESIDDGPNDDLYEEDAGSYTADLSFSSQEPLLVVKDGTFINGGPSFTPSWDDVESGASHGGFTVLGVNMSVRPGEVLAIVGPVGSGKSTIIDALIGEISVSPTTKLITRGKVAYASQVAFILNTSIRDNILFGNEFDLDRYNKVLDACCLREDIEQFSSGDMTEIGERGVTLSGGQKQRVSLARVVYSDPDIALFDDPLSALDAGTARRVFDRLFKQSGNDLLSRTAVVLVTHAAHFLNRVDQIMLVVDGKVPFCGTYGELSGANIDDPKARVAVDSILNAVQEDGNGKKEDMGLHQSSRASEINKPQEWNHSVCGTNEVGKFKKVLALAEAESLMSKETRESGLTQSWAWTLWFRYAGGVPFTSGLLVFFIAEKIFYFGTELWISYWTDAASLPITVLGFDFPAQTDGLGAQAYYMQVYCLLALLALACAFMRTIWIVSGGIRCSRQLYLSMTKRILHSPMVYFETTPMGRILNRFTYDAEILDITLVWSMSMLLIASSWFLTSLVVMVSILPWMFLVLLPVSVLYLMIHHHYRKSGADLQRLDAMSRSPLQTMLAEGIEGSATIRTFKKEGAFMNRFQHFADQSTAAQMNFLGAQRWLGVRVELLGAMIVFSASLAVIIFNERFGLGAGLAALLIRWSSGFTISLSFLLDNFAEAEGSVTAIERIQKMSEIEQEQNFDRNGTVPDSWPLKGDLEFSDVKMRYRRNLPLSLDGLSFQVNAGEHCGVVGRTGAGKSSLLSALFRLVNVESGSITIDGVDLSTVGLSDVRGPNGISIIPQDPFLFAGTLRECLDPFRSCSDDKLLDALASVRMFSSVRGELDVLDSRVEEGGANFSVGERSLLILARAMLAKPKLLLMDEATANIDGETDSFIQKMIRSRFAGTTLITIAHRLETIMDYDKVLVMENGKAAEFGSPSQLIDADGIFKDLINATGEGASALIRMASKADKERERLAILC